MAALCKQPLLTKPPARPLASLLEAGCNVHIDRSWQVATIASYRLQMMPPNHLASVSSPWECFHAVRMQSRLLELWHLRSP